MRIPMHGQIESLNAAVAGSVLLFEAVAQRDPEDRRETARTPGVTRALPEPRRGDGTRKAPIEPQAEPAEPPAAEPKSKRPRAPRPSAATSPGVAPAEEIDLLPGGLEEAAPEPKKPATRTKTGSKTRTKAGPKAGPKAKPATAAKPGKRGRAGATAKPPASGKPARSRTPRA
jgi:hypothetical protein